MMADPERRRRRVRRSRSGPADTAAAEPEVTPDPLADPSASTEPPVGADPSATAGEPGVAPPPPARGEPRTDALADAGPVTDSQRAGRAARTSTARESSPRPVPTPPAAARPTPPPAAASSIAEAPTGPSATPASTKPGPAPASTKHGPAPAPVRPVAGMGSPPAPDPLSPARGATDGATDGATSGSPRSLPTGETAPVHDPQERRPRGRSSVTGSSAAAAGGAPATPGAAPAVSGAAQTADDRDGERGLRGLVGSGSSQVSVRAAMRARDASRPSEDDLADAEQRLLIVRRNWVPREDLPRTR